MKEKRFIVQALEGAEEKRTYVIFEFPDVPNALPRPVAVCDTEDEIATFFSTYKFEVNN